MARAKPLAVVKDITLNQGADFRFQITVKGVNITGYTFSCKVRPEATSPEVVAEAKVNLIDPENGIVEFHFEDDDTGDIPIEGTTYEDMEEFTYDVLMIDPDGEATRLLNGMCYVSPGVSHY